MDKYWSDTIWQRTAQDRLNWRRHDYDNDSSANAYGQMTLVQIGRPTSSNKFPPFNNHRDIPIETSPRHSQPRRMIGRQLLK